MGISNSLIHGTRGQQHKFLLLSAPQCVLKLCSSLLTLPESARHKKQKSPQLRGLRDTLLHLTTGCSQTRNHSHSIVYGTHNQLTGNKFLKIYIHRTVLYTVTGNQYPEKWHITGSANRTAFHRLVRLLRPGQRTLPVVGFAREIC